jgi:hypothetical protein
MGQLVESVQGLTSLMEAEPVPPFSYKKTFPKRPFKGWKVRVNRPNHLWYEKGRFAFRIEDNGGYPDVWIQWPEELGNKVLDGVLGWDLRRNKSGKTMSAGFMSDAGDWKEDLGNLQRILKMFQKKSMEIEEARGWQDYLRGRGIDLDSAERSLFDQLVLIAENDGAAYRQKNAKAATVKAGRQLRVTKMRELDADLKKVLPLVQGYVDQMWQEQGRSSE